MDSPLIQVFLILLIAYIFHLWLSDLRSAQQGQEKRGALPGAYSCSMPIIILGLIGAVMLVGVETLGENALGLSAEQTSMTLLFGLVTLASGFGEELIFRGYFVIQKKGTAILWLSISGFSVLFALIHPYLWQWDEGTLKIEMSTKAWFSTGIVFLNSLWFYYLRFSKLNSKRSLWPCIAAHMCSNAAVFLVKLFQGHVSGLY
jgi:membrane protease YdiL (CAAX protease family)